MSQPPNKPPETPKPRRRYQPPALFKVGTLAMQAPSKDDERARIQGAGSPNVAGATVFGGG
jgi:hypothetical protein